MRLLAMVAAESAILLVTIDLDGGRLSGDMIFERHGSLVSDPLFRVW
jgi:hypothetical protein